MPTDAEVTIHTNSMQNLPNMPFNGTKNTTIFAEDLKVMSLRIAALETAPVAPAGAWSQVANILCNGTQSEMTVDGLNLATDKEYVIYFGISCALELTRLELHGVTQIFTNINGVKVAGGPPEYQSGIPFISHPSLGPATGKIDLQATPNGSTTIKIDYDVAGQRSYRLEGFDSGWFAGGPNLTKITLKGTTGQLLDSGSWMTLLKRNVA